MDTFADSWSPENPTRPSVPGSEREFSSASCRAKVFLAYRGTSEGEGLAGALYHRIKDEYDVTFAKEMPPGSDWAAYTAPKLDEADFLIALMTQEACDSSRSFYLPYEIQEAGKLYLKNAKPVIIPVRVAHLEPYDYRIGPILTRFHEIQIESSEDLGELVDKVKGALAERPSPPRDTFGAVLRDYVLSERDRLRLKASHVDLPVLQNAGTRLKAGDAVWLIGEAGVTSYTARSLAASTTADKRNIYVIPRGKSWEEVERTLVAEATIVFPDVLPSPFLSEDKAVSQLAALARLLSRSNRILLTAQEDAFEEARILMRRFGFRHQLSERLHHSLFNAKDKRHILEASLDLFARTGEIDERQLGVMRRVLAPRGDGPQERASRLGLAEETRRRFEQALERWAPSDVESFLLYHLPDIFRLTDLTKVLQRNATLDTEIHAWFSGLDDSAKCFVTTVALVDGLEGLALWERHKTVFAKLRSFDPHLALWPLGLSRERAAPYVTQDGVLGFREERIAEAVRREIALSYREYLVELVPDLRRWTMGDESTSAEDLLQIRHAVATLVGDAARVQLSDFLSLIEVWANDGDWKVRETAARALERLAADPPSQNVAFELLASWCARVQATQSWAWAWSAVAAYGRIATRNPRASDSRKALECLSTLAADEGNRMADTAVLAARKLAGRYRVDELEDLFRRLAHHRKAFVRLHLADTMNAACLADGSTGEQLLQSWVGDTEESLRFVAACCLILQVRNREWRNRSSAAIDILWNLLTSDAATLTDALIDVITSEKPPHWRKSGLETLARLLVLEKERDSNLLTLTLSKFLLEQRDRDLLRLLRADGNRFERFVVILRALAWRDFLEKPDELLTALEGELRHEPVPGEGYRLVGALTSLEQARNALVTTLASCFAEQNEAIESVLSWFRGAPQKTVASLSKEVRQQALSSLLASANVFVDLILTDCNHEARRAETWAILAHLAETKAQALVEALASAHSAKADAVEWLLVSFRTAGSTRSTGTGGAALARVANSTMGQILQRLLESNRYSGAYLVDQLQRMKKKPELWNEIIDTFDQMAQPSQEISRRQVIKSFASARHTRPTDVDALLQDTKLRTRRCLNNLWLWVRLEMWKPRIVVATVLLLGAIVAYCSASNSGGS